MGMGEVTDGTGRDGVVVTQWRGVVWRGEMHGQHSYL